MSSLNRDGTAEPVSRDQILRRERRQRNIHSPCSAGHERDWQPYLVDPSAAICDDHTATPVVQLIISKPSDVGTRVPISAQSHELRFFSHHAQQVENDYFVGTQNSTSRSMGERDG